MSKIVKEVATVESVGDGLLLIHYERSWDDGVKLGGDLVSQASAARWLADHIEAAVDLWSVPDVHQAMPPDEFDVFQRGGEHGEDVNVHVHNRRDPSAPRGGTYTLSGISPGAARTIAAQLRTIEPQ